MAATLDMVKLMGLPVAALEGMKTVFDGDNLKLIEAALAVHTAKPGKAKAAPPKEEEEAPKAKAKAKAAPAKPVAPPVAPPKVYVQRVEIYRGRARIKAVTRDQLDNVIAQLQALKSHPSLLTYAECQVAFPWDKEANRPA
ncbi:MAG: hypothetical protein NT171_16730 [Planctomycetota bacterium]|nr:hypothetical protein [Planctomycetota bacterium]